eukprot:TRINITY_DN2135_c3_g1_i1.p1 TRINITY_DN2135_c3_g1~~TRINITY_DN2135_c3_g1_i1.p1  ORF type:complete len:483 (+),score=75.02 TRINITY_DN2135_c3_g1_i1:51-1451(+)
MPPKKGPVKEKKRNIPKGKEGGGVELREAAKQGDTNAVRSLAVMHAVDEVDVRGFTALMWAAWYGHSKVIAALINRGSDLSIQDEDGQTALFHASWNGHSEAVSLLLRAGADPNQADSEGETPLSAAGRSGTYDCVRLLITHNADPNPRDKEGHNAVSRALKKGNTSIALLIEDYMRIYSQRGSGAALDSLLAMSLARHQEMQARNAALTHHHNPNAPQVLERGSYDGLTVISPELIRIVSRGKLPNVGATMRVNGGATEWYILSTVKGGGVKARSNTPGAANTWGDAGDEVGAGLWASVVPSQPGMVLHPQAGMVGSGSMGVASPPPNVQSAYQQYQYYQQNQRVMPAQATPPPVQHQQTASKQHIAFGNAGAREASMPLAGVPSPGSPRKTTRRSGYKRDNPAYRAPNGCTVCSKVRPPLSYCEECNEEMCSGCWVREHQNRKRRLHIPHPVELEVIGSDEEDE